MHELRWGFGLLFFFGVGAMIYEGLLQVPRSAYAMVGWDAIGTIIVAIPVTAGIVLWHGHKVYEKSHQEKKPTRKVVKRG